MRFDGDSRRYRPPTANFHMSLQHRHRPTAQRNQQVKYSRGCEIWELEYPLFPQPCSTKSNHRLLNHIPDYHSKRLRVLVVCSGTPMLESTVLMLRDTASQLRHLELSQWLTIETRGTFTDPRVWACAGRLEDLYILRCAPQLSCAMSERGYLVHPAHFI